MRERKWIHVCKFTNQFRSTKILNFSYHQKVPYDPPQLELKATYGLVKPEPLSMPPPSPLWNPASYAAFDTAMAAARDPKAVIKNVNKTKL
jgi:hypothetical protein